LEKKKRGKVTHDEQLGETKNLRGLIKGFETEEKKNNFQPKQIRRSKKISVGGSHNDSVERKPWKPLQDHKGRL